MKRISLVLWACVFCAGCQEAPAPPEAAVEALHVLPVREELAITERSLAEALTEEEVRGFIELVKSLPDGKPPTFTPVSTGAKVQGLHLDEAIKAWRGAVRDALTVESLLNGWNPKAPVRWALVERNVPTKALASLMLRLSCAMGVDAMGGHRNVAAQRVITDEKIDSIISLIQRMDRAGQPIADSYWQGLEEAVSLSEYLNVLLEVPTENQVVVAGYQADLQAMLPVQSNRTAPTETREDTRIVPVRFDEPSPRSSRQRTR